MNIQLLGELMRTNLKPLYHFKLPDSTGDKSLNVFRSRDYIDWEATGNASTGQYWEYDTLSWSNYTKKIEKHKYFTTVTKYKSFMQRIKTWEEESKRKQNVKGKKWSGTGWEF